MDDNKETKPKNSLFGGLSSSLLNIFNKFSSETKNDFNAQFESINKNNLVDLDKSDDEDINLPKCTKQRIDVNKRKYNETLSSELRNQRSKRIIVDSNIDEQSVKRAKLNATFSGINMMSNEEFMKPKFNYRSAAVARDIKVCNYSQNDSFSRFGSVQSLTESMDESFQSATASRISNNFFSQKDIPFHSPAPTSTMHRPMTPYSMNSRRFKTVTKKDRLSSYLSREIIPENENLFSVPSVAPPLAVILTPNKDDNLQRFNLSQLRKTPSEKNNSNKVEIWTCDQCDTNNPINFNFCPSCSNSNPLNKHNRHHDKSIDKKLDDDAWKCYRCLTMNSKERRCCVCCFIAKNALPAQKRIDDDNLSISSQSSTKSVNRDMEISKDPPTQTITGTTSTDIPRQSKYTEKKSSINNLQSTKFKFASSVNDNLGSQNKIVGVRNDKISECPSCMVENYANDAASVCCCTNNTKSQKSNSAQSVAMESEPKTLFKFGNFVNSNHKLNKWECPSCLVENDANDSACVCCGTKNPKSNGSTIIQSSVKENESKTSFIFGANVNSKSEAKNWECPTCMVDNSADDNVCVCCATSNPTSSSVKVPLIIKNSQSMPTIKFGSSVNSEPETKKWECPSCMVENEPLSPSCPCCGTMNGNIVPPSFQFGNGPQKITFGTNNSRMDTENPKTKSTFKFGSSKLTELDSDDGSSSEKIKFGAIFGTFDKPPSKTTKESKSTVKWSCSTCLADNDARRSSCVCCEAQRPATKEDALNTSVSNGPTTTTFTFGSATELPKFTFGSSTTKMASGTKWNCPSCMVDNEAHATACVCCMTANTTAVTADSVRPASTTVASNDGSAAPTFTFGSSTKVPAAIASNGTMSNGLGATFTDPDSMMDFAFSAPDSLPCGSSKTDLTTDIDFAFSAAGRL